MLCETEMCTGCSACATVCPSACLNMVPDEMGFLYPEIDEDICIGCKACESVCPILSPVSTHNTVTAFAAKNRSLEQRLTATSGGIFELISNYVLNQNGVVFGASYDEFYHVHHICIETREELAKLKGAKYSQSDVADAFSLAKHALETNRSVLFSGTACQIVGLKNYLGKDYDSLICVDLICHGVPSPAVWQKYINERAYADNRGIKPHSINLRCKMNGWQDYSVSFDYGIHQYVVSARKDPYIQGFIHDLYLRPSCHSCTVKGLKRASDFTLGDYWGIGDQYPEFNDDKGTSIVLLHSEKAKQVWQTIRSQVYSLEVDAERAVCQNAMAIESTPKSPLAQAFRQRWKKESLDELVWDLVQTPIPLKKLTITARIKKMLLSILFHRN